MEHMFFHLNRCSICQDFPPSWHSKEVSQHKFVGIKWYFFDNDFTFIQNGIFSFQKVYSIEKMAPKSNGLNILFTRKNGFIARTKDYTKYKMNLLGYKSYKYSTMSIGLPSIIQNFEHFVRIFILVAIFPNVFGSYLHKIFNGDMIAYFTSFLFLAYSCLLTIWIKTTKAKMIL